MSSYKSASQDLEQVGKVKTVVLAIQTEDMQTVSTCRDFRYILNDST
jgi:hypothetical protein